MVLTRQKKNHTKKSRSHQRRTSKKNNSKRKTLRRKQGKTRGGADDSAIVSPPTSMPSSLRAMATSHSRSDGTNRPITVPHALLEKIEDAEKIVDERKEKKFDINTPLCDLPFENMKLEGPLYDEIKQLFTCKNKLTTLINQDDIDINSSIESEIKKIDKSLLLPMLNPDETLKRKVLECIDENGEKVREWKDKLRISNQPQHAKNMANLNMINNKSILDIIFVREEGKYVTLCYIAAKKGQHDVVQLLLYYGAEPDLQPPPAPFRDPPPTPCTIAAINGVDEKQKMKKRRNTRRWCSCCSRMAQTHNNI